MRWSVVIPDGEREPLLARAVESAQGCEVIAVTEQVPEGCRVVPGTGLSLSERIRKGVENASGEYCWLLHPRDRLVACSHELAGEQDVVYGAVRVGRTQVNTYSSGLPVWGLAIRRQLALTLSRLGQPGWWEELPAGSRLFHLGSVCCRQDEAERNLPAPAPKAPPPQDAILELMEQACAGAPDQPQVAYRLALLLLERNRLYEGWAQLEKARRLGCSDPELEPLLLDVLDKATRANDRCCRIQAYWELSRRKPEDADCWLKLGLELLYDGRSDLAEHPLRKASELSGHPRAKKELAVILRQQGCLEEAERLLLQALEAWPRFTEALVEMKILQDTRGRPKEALDWAQRAVESDPYSLPAHFARATAGLAVEDWSAGHWAEYEWRFDVGERPWGGWNPVWGKVWDGRQIPQETLLVRAEQGAGDCFQFFRYLEPARARVGQLILETPCTLARIASTCRGVDAIVRAPSQVAPGRYWEVALHSLPLVLGLHHPKQVATIPYFHVARPPRPSHLRVGLVWQGNPRHERDSLRSMGVAPLAPLLALDGIEFWSLVAKGQQALQSVANGSSVRDASPQLTDWADTAELLLTLDLLISVDTGVAHLAGGLGVPVWLLLYWPSEWRWGQQPERTDWYPNHRLWRQKPGESWLELTGRVAAALEVWAQVQLVQQT